MAVRVGCSEGGVMAVEDGAVTLAENGSCSGTRAPARPGRR